MRTTPTLVTGGHTFASIGVGGGDHTCGITTAGETYCWGRNLESALGDGTTSNRNTPTLVIGGQTFGSVAPGYGHTCARTAAGQAWCWGDNGSGQLGDGTFDQQAAPVLVGGGFSFVQLALGSFHACGRTAAGELRCWGSNDTGQLGDGNLGTPGMSPVLVAGGFTFTAVDAGTEHTCAIASTTSREYCWGNNSGGQLGNGFAATIPSPRPVALTVPLAPPVLASRGR